MTMSALQPITEIIILHLKADVSLETVEHDMSTDTDTVTAAAQAFILGLNTIQAQSGFIRQYWVFKSLHKMLLQS